MTTSTQPGGAFRRLAHRLHMCLGVTVGFYILLMSATGTSLVFNDEILSWTEPKVSQVAGIEPVSYEFVVDSVQKKFGSHKVKWLHRQSSADAPLEVYLSKGNDRRVELVNPYSGELLGQRNPVVQFFMNLHFDLLNGDLGRTANGVGAACLFTILMSGIIIWWQGLKRIGSRLSVDMKANWRRVNWDLHTAISIWAVPFVLIWSTSGFYFGFPDTFKKVLSVVVPVDGPKVLKRNGVDKPGERAVVDSETAKVRESIHSDDSSNTSNLNELNYSAKQRLSVDELVRMAEQKGGGSKVRWVKIADLSSGKTVRILLSPQGVSAKDQMTEMYLYPDSGDMKSVVVPADRPAGANFIEFLKKLHFGTIFGTYSKFVWVMIGIIPGTLFVTGFLIWLNKKTSKKK